jgi:hypothetical protein
MEMVHDRCSTLLTEFGTALTTILPIDKISQQPENCENRNDPDLLQAFLKKWWVQSDIKVRMHMM